MKKGDFVRIKYSGKVKGVDKALDIREDAPVIVGVGNVMKGVDTALLDMKVGDKKTVEVSPEEGFGARDPKRIKLVPMGEFKKHGQTPKVGMKLNANGVMATVISIAGGRVKIDFNHPLAGKTLVYDLEVKSQIEKIEGKVKAIVEFYYDVSDQNVKKQMMEKLEVKDGDKAVELIVPVMMEINSVYRRKIAFEIMKHLEMEYVKFSEIFEKPDQKKIDEIAKKLEVQEVSEDSKE